MPVSPRNSSGAPVPANCERRRLTSFTKAERPRFASASPGGAAFSCERNARFTVASSFCSAIGFSKKSSAPMRVASTAVSMVACPDIITTGIVSCPLAAHSLSKEMPSVSGIQISRRTRSGRALALSARAAVAFSARRTLCPSSERISDKSSRMPISSSTTSICAMALRQVELASFTRPRPRAARSVSEHP